MEIIKINSRKLEKQKLLYVAQLIRSGGVVIFPTDTVYIPVADATNRKAVEKVFLIKKRSPKKPIPIFVKDIKLAKKLAKVDKEQELFLRKVWPGRVTAVLKRKSGGPKIYGVEEKSIALRIPNYRPVHFLLEKLNRPLVGTSANISGQPSSGDIKDVLAQFKNRKYQPDLIIDAGKLPKRRPSKVVDLTNWPPKILRA